MKVLFDTCVPRPLRGLLPGYAITTAQEAGWDALNNGELVAAAESLFDVLVTADQNLRYQQNLAGRRIALLVLPTNHWPTLKKMGAEVTSALALLPPGGFIELPMP